MKFAIIPIEVIELSGTTSHFKIAEVLEGVILKCPSGKYQVLIEAECSLGYFDSLEDALKAISDIYILLGEHDARYCVNQLKTCLKKYLGLDLRHII